jgi:excisionase family DNA binding protein
LEKIMESRQLRRQREVDAGLIFEELSALKFALSALQDQVSLQGQLAYSFDEVGKLLGGQCDAKTVRREWEEGRIKAVKVRGLRRVTREDLKAYILRLRCEGGVR